MPDYEAILLKFLESLAWCEHMGDVSNEMLSVLTQMGLEPPPNICEDDLRPLGRWLEEQRKKEGAES